MDIKVTTLDGGDAGSVTLSDAIFGLEPRADIIQRCVVWQLNKRRAGTHAVKNRADIWRTGKKMYGQKGTGGARHGSARVPQFRGGGRAFGPVVRSHEIGLPKKIRALALKHALSSKAKDGGWIVITMAWGLAVFVGVYAGYKTGAHLNPAVTIGLAVAGRPLAEGISATPVNILVYCAAQMVGAMAGAADSTWMPRAMQSSAIA